MALKNIKNIRQERGFTIVELLIVIVVIAILATISIVAYSGIQARAKTTKGQANASLIQKIAEAYNADNSVYPTQTANFTTSTTTLPSTVHILTASSISTIPSLTSANGDGNYIYRYVGTAPNATGACVFYFDFTANAISSAIYMGNGSATNCSGTTGTTGNTPTS